MKLQSTQRFFIEETNLNYSGSLTLPEKYGFLGGQQVDVWNVETGECFTTYIIIGDNVCLNGPAARKGQVGDRIEVLVWEV